MPQFFKCLKIFIFPVLIVISTFLICLHLSNNAPNLFFLREIGNNNITEVKKKLRRNKALANSKYINSYTALHLATRNNNREMILVLLRNGADANIKSDSNDTCLTIASEYGYLEVAKILIDNGANINQRGGRHEDTPLHIAVCKGNEKFVKLLINHGADINISNSLGDKAIDLAKQFGNNEIIQVLNNKSE